MIGVFGSAAVECWLISGSSPSKQQNAIKTRPSRSVKGRPRFFLFVHLVERAHILDKPTTEWFSRQRRRYQSHADDQMKDQACSPRRAAGRSPSGSARTAR